MRARGTATALAAALVAMAVPGAATAQGRAAALARPWQEPARRELALELSAFAELPLFVGGSMGLELFDVVVLRFGAGVVPGAFVDAVNEVGAGLGAWSAADGQIARGVLTDALLLETTLALRPTGSTGLELAVGHVLVWAHGELPAAMLGPLFPAAVGLDLSAHAVHAEVGFVAPIGPLIVRVALGWLHTLGRSARLVGAEASLLAPIARALEGAVDAAGLGPTLSVTAGLRL